MAESNNVLAGTLTVALELFIHCLNYSNDENVPNFFYCHFHLLRFFPSRNLPYCISSCPIASLSICETHYIGLANVSRIEDPRSNSCGIQLLSVFIFRLSCHSIETELILNGFSALLAHLSRFCRVCN
jgi:hypothetical protein